MRVSSLLLSASLSTAAIIPRQTDNTTCTNPVKRVEWRTLGAEVQKQYIDAVLCLKTKPSGIGLDTSRYDDFPYVHTKMDTSSAFLLYPFSSSLTWTNAEKPVHTVAMFLPWHRLFVQIYEDSLRDCGYTGSMPYWDWTLDTDDVTKAPVWDTETGLGGNGDPAIDPITGNSKEKCVVDGPLKNFEVAYTMDGYEPHCLTRNWNSGVAFPGNMLAEHYTKEVIDNTTALETYPEFRYQLEGEPHGAIHSAVGGDMSPATSPNDPIFFLHHTQVDRLWTLWQNENPEVRTTEFGGPKTQNEDPGEATLEDIMPYLDLVPDVKVSEMMSTQTSRLCYVY